MINKFVCLNRCYVEHGKIFKMYTGTGITPSKKGIKLPKKSKKNIKDENKSPNRNPTRPTISTGAKRQNATTAAGLSSSVVSKPR